ncbi:MAG: hypothetical protein AAGL99_04220 [Pseudomonadota bacterium]
MESNLGVWRLATHLDVELTVEFTEKVAYAYVRRDNAIVGDVWLFNRGATPTIAPWKVARSPSDAPFMNSADYVGPGGEDRISTINNLSARFDERTNDFEVRRDGVVIALLAVGDKPGGSYLAVRSGPLAVTIEE